MEHPATPRVAPSTGTKRSPTTPLTPSLVQGNIFKRSTLIKTNAKLIADSQQSTQIQENKNNINDSNVLNEHTSLETELNNINMSKSNWLKDQKIKRLQDDLEFLELERKFNI